MKTRSFLFAVFSFLCGCTVGAQAASVYVTAPKKLSFEILSSGADEILNVPLIFSPNVKSTDLEADLWSVVSGRRQTVELKKSFEPRLTSEALEVTVHSQKLKAGTYNVTVSVYPKAGTLEEQLIDLEIIHPTAALAVPSTLVIHDVRACPFASGVTSSGKIQFRETSGNSWISNLQIVQIDESSNDSQFLKFPNLINQRIEPGASGNIVYELSGTSALGISKGKLEVRAPQFEQPVTMNFQVDTRLNKIYVLLIIAAGLIAGVLIRIKLAQKIALNKARVQGFDLLAEIQKRKDGELQNNLRPLVVRLKTILEGHGKHAELENAIKDTNDSLVNEIQQLHQRRIEANQEVNKFEEIFAIDWKLPDLSNCLEVGKTHLAEAIQAMDEDDPTGATQKCMSGLKSVTDCLNESTKSWKPWVKDWMNEITDIDLPFPTRLSQGVKTKAEKINSDISNLPSFHPKPAYDDAKTFLTNIFIIRQMVQEIVSRFGVWAEQSNGFADELLKLRADKIKNPEAVIELKHKAFDLLNLLMKVWDGPPVDAKAFLQMVSELNNAWRNALLKQVTEPEVISEVMKALDAFEYLDAGRTVLNSWNRAMPATSLAWKDLAIVEKMKASPMDGPQFTTSLMKWFRADVLPPQIPVTRAIAMRELARARAWEIILSSLGIFVVGWSLYQADFVGTLNDFIKIFAFAYGIDLSIAAVIGAGRQIVGG